MIIQRGDHSPSPQLPHPTPTTTGITSIMQEPRGLTPGSQLVRVPGPDPALATQQASFGNERYCSKC